MGIATLTLVLLLGTLQEREAAFPTSSPAATVASAGTGCALETLDADAALVADCVSCHGPGHASSRSHPVGVDYASAQVSSKGSLAPPDAVTRAGVFVPDGKIQCVTCHDPRSPWADHVAIPPGVVPIPAVIPGVPETYDTSKTEGQPAPGSRVSAKPLCLACHAF